ncbi:MAG: ASPIC/UnbV domain-containing protein [Lewinellaceae bacterium]|nr:ASPIC/UnbV domain-containing protein [Lewinellaceae bacterium]
MDLAVANCYNTTQPDYLYENHASESGNNWVFINCIGTVSNRSAIGAKVLVTATINGQQVTRIHEISAQSGYCGQNQLGAHFGLGDATDFSVSVQWPSGIEESYGNLFADQYITVTENQGVTGVETPLPGQTGLRMYPPAPNPFNDLVTVTWEQLAAGTILIEITDLQGKTLVSEKRTGEAGNINGAGTAKMPGAKKCPQVSTLRC